MNYIDESILSDANKTAIYNLYSYLADKTDPAKGETLASIVESLNKAYNSSWNEWITRDLKLLKTAVNKNSDIAASRLIEQIKSLNGLNAWAFIDPKNKINVVFRGTGKGEWIDNGEGLSGVPEKNTYLTFEDGKIIKRTIVNNDFATDQQVGALNWFNKIASKHGWEKRTKITVSGHSKGGNKAQFVAISSDLVDRCYSFDGQGFSPEALSVFRRKHGPDYEKRRQRMYSFSADNDYVNVLGCRLVPIDNIIYFKTEKMIPINYHHLYAMLDSEGKFNQQSEQGDLSKYMESISNELMALDPAIRRYATLGIMNLFQKYWGKGIPVNGDSVSTEKTIVGIGVTAGLIIDKLFDNNK